MRNFIPIVLLALPAPLGATQSVLHSYDIGIPGATNYKAPLANVGDVNADGIPDHIVAAEVDRTVQNTSTWMAQVRSGADGTRLYEVERTFRWFYAGYAVAGAGDLNADGFSDFLVGAPIPGSQGAVPDGVVMAYSGRDGAVLHRITDVGEPQWIGNTWIGTKVAGVGDVDSDGHDDFLIVAFEDEGYVHSGATGGVLYKLDTGPIDGLLHSLVTGFDFDQDGTQDLLAGFPSGQFLGTGAARVFSGVDGSRLQLLSGSLSNEQLGSAVAAMDDVDGDGVLDFVAGGRSSRGHHVRALSGRTGATLWVASSDEYDFLGHVIEAIRDYDGDGYRDLLPSAPKSARYTASGAEPAGSVVLLSGKDGTRLLEWGATNLQDPLSNLGLGQNLASAGDLDGDGIDEWIVSDLSQFIRIYSSRSPGSAFCLSTVNSTGSQASIRAAGALQVHKNDLLMIAEPVPNELGLFFYGQAQVQVPFGDGFRCVGGSLSRLGVASAEDGVLVTALDLANPPSQQGQITAGSTWNFQAWFRDTSAGGAGFNLSDGMQMTFAP